MSSKRKWTAVVTGALVVGAIGVSAVAFQPSMAYAAGNVTGAVRSMQWGMQGDWGRGGWMQDDFDHQAALAAALGITEEELTTAQTTAHQAALDAAVADGRITQDQADAMAARMADAVGVGFGFHRGPGGLGAGDTYLADALGITAEELTAAQEQVMADRIAAAIEAGDITQEQADRMAAHQALRAYQAGQAQTEAAAQIDAALAAGSITEAQAELLRSDLEQGLFGGPGFGGMRGHGGFGGFDGGRMGRSGMGFGGDFDGFGGHGGRGMRGPGNGPAAGSTDSQN